MSILTSPLADCIIYNDEVYHLKTDFRIWLKFEQIMQDKNLSVAAKTGMIYDLCFEEPPPQGAVFGALWNFYKGDNDTAPVKKGKPVVSFEQDADYIFAAFYSQYGIDLSCDELHWHKFKALFAGLNEEHMITRIMHFRSMDISQIKDKGHKAYYRKMKKLFRIKTGETSVAENIESLF